MYKEQQVLTIKPGQEQDGLPPEVTITKIEGDAIHITFPDGTFESAANILDTFYDVKEEFTSESMPQMTIKAIDEIVGLFDIFASTENPMAGLTVKTRLLALKDNVARTAGIKTTVSSILGKKIS